MQIVQLSKLVDMDNPYRVMEEVKTIIRDIYGDYDFNIIDQVFSDTLDLFMGRYPGYKACNCRYHDLIHTTDTLLAMARLIHGAVLNGVKFSTKDVDLGISSALLHDTGYIQELGDDEGTGAKYTLVHIDRSIEFSMGYLPKLGFSERDFRYVESILRCTGLNVRIEEVEFFSKEHELLGKMLGTADLMGQMASRTYLEKLPYLYSEFKEGKVPGYESEFDLIKKTPDFYRWILKRFKEEFDSVYRFMKDHFEKRWGIKDDLYMITIEKNINYLEYIIKDHPKDYRRYLRRRLDRVVLKK